VCDARSIVPERDLIHTDTLYVDEVVESSSVLHHPQQKWYYLSGHMPDEILVFLGADSEIPGKGGGFEASSFL
jgi:predicted Rdx family selenoprotein